MSPFPVHFTGRWDNPSRLSYDDAVCWHLLLGGDTAVQAAVATARERLARFSGLHMTPPEWLHVTILRAGTADMMTQDDISRMLTRAQADLARTAPVTVTLQHVFYHPEAIVLGVSPGSVLAPVLAAARTATREVLGVNAADAEDDDEFTPHLTLCYSTEEQPAAPVIAELGKTLPPCQVTIRELSLVVQDGPEDQWNWQVAGSARLLGGLDASGVLPPRAVRAGLALDAPPAWEAAGHRLAGSVCAAAADCGGASRPVRYSWLIEREIRSVGSLEG
jgi:2'-5' RNA ligase